MMLEYLDNLSRQGIELWTDGNQLYYRGSRQVLTPLILSKVKENKTEIVKLLKEGKYVSKVFPLSYPQRALWFLYHSAPESPAYNTAMAIRLHFEVNKSTLRSALQALLTRHSTLRTTFSLEDGVEGSKSIQKVYAYREVCFEQIDASTWSQDELREMVKGAHERPFDLEKGPAFRASLFTRNEKDHVLLISIHHIVCDGWSMWTLMDELWKIYFAYESGKSGVGKNIQKYPEEIKFKESQLNQTATGLVKLTHSYEDFVRWQAEMLDSAEGERQWQYWQKQLSGELPVLNLPLDRPRLSIQTYKGDWIPFRLDKELSGQIAKFAKDKGVTLYTLLLCAYQILLHRYTGQEDILVGCPTTGRPQKNFDGIVGHFVNTVPVRADFSDNPTFNEFIRQTHHTLLDALEHQEYPFSLLVDRLNPKRDPSRPPIFQTMFVFQKPHNVSEGIDGITDFYTSDGKMKVDDLEFESFPISQQEGQFDMSIEITGSETSLKGVLKYNRDLYYEDSMMRMVAYFSNLLQSIVTNPEQHISELQLITEEEKQKILVEWNNTGREWDIKCVHELFEEQVKRTPDATAIVFNDKQLSYIELNQRANKLARFLTKHGIKPDDPIGICVERSFEMIVGIMGILKAGGAYVPLDPKYPRERLLFMLKNSQIPTLLASDHLADLFQSTDVDIIRIDEDWQMIAQESELDECRNFSAGNLAYILYTSGSTGQPKGVAMPHRSLCNLIQWQNQNSITSKNAKTLQFTTLNFDVSFQEIFSTLGSGGTLLLIEEELRLDPVALLRLIIEETVERVFIPFVYLQMLADTIETYHELLPLNLREIITAGEQLRITRSISNLFKRLDHCTLYNQYGPTETHVVTSFTLKGDPDKWPFLPSIGKPIANTRMYILDKHLKPVPLGVSGELYTGGICLARGYHQQPELTKKSFIENPFLDYEERLYRTGDLARFLSDGNIEFLGRADHQIKISGFRIELAEIENQLLNHKDVSDAVVLSREDHNGLKSLCAYFVSERELSDVELKGYLSEKIPSYMVPSYFVSLRKIPLLPNNKVDRLSLPQPEQSVLARVEYVAPRDEVEEKLAEICRGVLNMERLGVNDDLFDFGVNSLTTLIIQRKIDQFYPGKIRIPDIMQYSTISNLADILKNRKTTDLGKSGREEQLQIFLARISQED